MISTRRAVIMYHRAESDFSLPFNEMDKATIIKIWERYKKEHLYTTVPYRALIINHENVRLQDINQINGHTVIIVAKTDFYSLVIANIIRSRMNGFKNYIRANFNSLCREFVLNKKQEGKAYLTSILYRLDKYYSESGGGSDFVSLIRNGNLPNAMAVSVLLMDNAGNVLLTKRTNNVGIGADLYSVTVTGAIDSNDWEADDIIRNCAARELKEELGISLPAKALEITALVAGKIKKQPVAIVNGQLKDLRDIPKTERFDSFEIEKLYMCRNADIPDMIKKHKFTEAAGYHLYLTYLKFNRILQAEIDR